MEKTVDIRGFITNSLVEWEGRICAVVFTAGCNWRCPYCHGWRLVTDTENLLPIAEEKVFELLEKQGKWVDGVAITGGEPTLQPGLVDFIRRIKSHGVGVKLETNGTHPEVIRKLLDEQLIDCLCLDYKAPLDDRLFAVTSVGEDKTRLTQVKESFALAAASGLEREYHTTLCPKFVDEAIIEHMSEALEDGGLWVLQQYELDDRLDPEVAGDKRFDSETLDRIEAAARKHHEKILMRRGKGA